MSSLRTEGVNGVPKMTQTPVTDPEADPSPSAIQSHIFRQTAQPLGGNHSREKLWKEILGLVEGRG